MAAGLPLQGSRRAVKTAFGPLVLGSRSTKPQATGSSRAICIGTNSPVAGCSASRGMTPTGEFRLLHAGLDELVCAREGSVHHPRPCRTLLFPLQPLTIPPVPLSELILLFSQG